MPREPGYPDKREGYPGSGGSASMPPPPPDPSGSPPPTMPGGTWVSGFDGPALTALPQSKVVALQAAAELVGLASELVSRDDLPGLGGIVLEIAERFESWLIQDPPEPEIPLDPHWFVEPTPPVPKWEEAALCQYATGPDRTCGRRRDDPMHAMQAP